MQIKPGPTSIPGKPRPHFSAFPAHLSHSGSQVPPAFTSASAATIYFTLKVRNILARRGGSIWKTGEMFMVLHGGQLMPQTLSKLHHGKGPGDERPLVTGLLSPSLNA